MKEQNKKEKKYNNGFIRRLIIDYLHYFISFLSSILSLVSLIYIIHSQFLLTPLSYCYHSPSIMIKNAPKLMEAEKAGPEYPSGFRRIDRSRVIINPQPLTMNH